jgi:hypothetical protein
VVRLAPLRIIYSLASAPLGRRLIFAPRNFWSCCSATTSGWSMTVGVVGETLKVQSSLLSTLHMLSSKHGDFRFQFGARRDQPFRPDLR